MSAVDERGALDRPMSLLEHATRLQQQNPNDPLPCGGRPYPDDGTQPRRPERRAPASERTTALLAVLEAFMSDPSASLQRLHDELSRLDLFGSTVETAIDKLPALDTERIRETGAWLVRHATDRRPAAVGLALLATASKSGDISLIRTIGLLDRFGPAAARALANLPGATADLIWLTQRSRRWARVKAIEALCQRGDPQAVTWLRHHAVGDEDMSASLVLPLLHTTVRRRTVPTVISPPLLRLCRTPPGRPSAHEARRDPATGVSPQRLDISATSFGLVPR